MTTREKALEQFLSLHGLDKYRRQTVSGDASFRSYQRIFTDSKTLIIMDAPPPQEDVKPYIKIDEFLFNNHFSAPEIFYRDEKQGFLILEDFGDELFSKILSDPLPYEKEFELYKLALDTLDAMRKTKTDASIPQYSDEILNRELTLFTDWYLPHILKIKLSDKDKNAFLNMWKDLFAESRKETPVFVFRDYHVSNMIFLKDRVSYKKVGLLDFQDALLGPDTYDLVSLLEDARRDVSPELAKDCLEYYIAKAGIKNKEQFITNYNIFGAQRNLKIIGIFTRLSYRDGKHSYLSMIPRVWQYLESDLSHPSLKKISDYIHSLVSPEQRKQVPANA